MKNRYLCVRRICTTRRVIFHHTLSRWNYNLSTTGEGEIWCETTALFLVGDPQKSTQSTKILPKTSENPDICYSWAEFSNLQASWPVFTLIMISSVNNDLTANYYLNSLWVMSSRILANIVRSAQKSVAVRSSPIVLQNKKNFRSTYLDWSWKVGYLHLDRPNIMCIFYV